MPTVEEALEAGGLNGEKLLKLSRKAAQDALRRSGAYLDPDRFDDLAGFMLEVGVRYVPRYDPSYGIALSTFLYRRMRIRYVDWLRKTLGDPRYPHRMKQPPGGFAPLSEFDGAYHEPGYERVEAKLSAGTAKHSDKMC